MSETTTNETTAPAPEQQRAPRGLISQKWIDEVNKAEEILAIARKEEYRERLQGAEITGEFLDGVAADVEDARTIIAQATQKTVAARTATSHESATREKLLGMLDEVQARARQKYAATNKIALKDYLVGENISSSRARLEQGTQTILNKLASDTLPGMTPEKIAAMANLLVQYKELQTTQTSEQSDATSSRAQLKEMIDAVVAYRRKIQFAADAIWPARNPANAGIRGEFRLPADRTMI